MSKIKCCPTCKHLTKHKSDKYRSYRRWSCNEAEGGGWYMNRKPGTNHRCSNHEYKHDYDKEIE